MSIEGNVKEEKQAIRKQLRATLSTLSDDYILQSSQKVASQLFELPQYKASKGVACFLSMPKEFNTRSILEKIFMDGKSCYLPRVESVRDSAMVMLKAESMQDVDSFPPGKWNIPEPPRSGPARLEALDSRSDLDLVIVPGLGFDYKNGRLGQGAGFYDRYLSRMKQTHVSKKVFLVGVTLDELMIESVPRDDNDMLMDVVLWPSKPNA
eukprot:754632-Hanusia_phi.AAC.6